MEKVTVTRKLDGSEAVVKMTVIDDKRQSRERDITMATKLYDGGKTEKRIYRFLSPADVQGTSVLVFDYEAKPDDVWIYLPALRKTRRIVSSQRTQSFMGSEFSYGDLNIPALDDFDYTLVKEEPFGGETCYVIDVAAEEQGDRRERGLLEEDLLGQQGQVRGRARPVLRQGRQAAEGADHAATSSCSTPKNKRYRPMRMEMINKQNGRSSVFESKKVTFAPSTKDEYFTTAYLERS